MKNNFNIDQGYIPPQATDVEQAVLGAFLVDYKNCVYAQKMLAPEMFYKTAHQEIYRCISEIDGVVDVLVVAEALKKKGTIDQVGGMVYISHLCTGITGGWHSKEHALIIVEKYVKRLYIQYSAQIQKMCYEDLSDVFELQGIVNQLFQDVDKVVARGGGAIHIAEILKDANKELESRVISAKAGAQTGIDTGFGDLNGVILGWQKSDLIIQAARPGMGKTAMALHHAYAAARASKSVCMYSLEMSSVRLIDRLILKLAGIDTYRYKSGTLDESEFAKYQVAVGELERLPIYVDDNPIVSMDYISASSLVMKQQGKCDMVIIDYLQLAEMAKQKGKSREQEVSEASRKGKILAKTLDAPVLLLSQLNRSVEIRGGEKRPNLSDLRDSGAIEQDADIVMFIYRPEYYGIKEDGAGTSTEGYGEIIIAKHRNGALGKVRFGYNPSMTLLGDYIPELPDYTPF